MIIVICTTENDTITGKPRKIVSHGVDNVTGKNICLPCDPPEDIGAIFDPEIGEYVLPRDPATAQADQSPAQKDALYYPCIVDPRSGHVSKKVGDAMSKERAEELLKARFPALWRSKEAIPQPVEHHYFA